jgi:hypothetical protein
VAARLLPALLAAILCATFSQPGLAAKTGELARAAAGHIGPAPKGKYYRLFVLGDSLATNLADGLIWALRDVRDVEVVKRTRAATGLVRDDVLNWTRSVARLLDDENVDIAVIAIGGNDRQDIRVGGRRYARFTKPWRTAYLRRVERFMRVFDKRTAVYWVGLPRVRSTQMSRDYRRLNAYYRHLARAHGIKFIDIFDRFSSPSGGYTAYGRGLDGGTERLRDGDGIHFTLVGARMLGRAVAEEIRRDLRAARAARSGSPAEN